MASLLVPHDRSLVATGIQVKLVTGPIEFQYPPNIKDDSREGNWNEVKTGPNAGDPIATYEYAGPRKITMEWFYIVNGVSGWPVSKIQKQLTAIRGYFTNPGLSGGAYSDLVIMVQIWGMGGR